MLKEGQFSQANLAFEWIVFQSEDPEEIRAARLGRARSLKKMGEYERASSVLSSINLLSASRELRPVLVYEDMLLRYLISDFQGSVSKGLFAKTLFQEGEYLQPYRLLMSISHYQIQNFEQGELYGKQYLNSLDSTHTTDLLIRFDSLTNLPLPILKNPKKASNLSTFLPGLGQVYAGSTGEGMLSFGLHTISLGGAVLAAFGGYYISAWLGAAIIIQRLHAGGRSRSSALAEKNNRLEINQYSQPIIQFLLIADSSTL